MLKRIAAVSAIVLAVCLIAFFALSPLAVSDAVKLAQQSAPAYAVLTELAQYSAENVEVVTLTGSWASSLEVRPSSDNKIHLLTDNYSVATPLFKPRPAGDGTLELYCVFENPSPISLLTRESLQRLLIAHLNNASLRRIVLELPSSVAFKPGEHSPSYYSAYYDLLIDERITVLTPESPAVPVEGPPFEASEAAPDLEEAASSEAAPVL